MPFLLMVFLVLVCVPEMDVWKAPPWPESVSPWWCVAATWFAVALTGAHAFAVARRVRQPMASDPLWRERLLNRYERGRFHHQIGLFVMYMLALLVLGWGWAVAQLWRWDADALLPGAELLVLAPFIVGQMLAWSVYYDAERASHLPPPLLALRTGEAHTGAWLELERPRGGAAAAVFGSRASYVLFQLRQKLALVFLPVFLLLTLKELSRLFPDMGPQWQGIINGIGIATVLLVFAAMPWIVRLALGLKPLPPGPLRQRLEAVSQCMRFRCGNILVWNTRLGMANAMVIGIVPWIRYVVLTDRLLEEFTPEEVEAVFGHEIGHIRHRHMQYYFGFLTASVLVLGWLGCLYQADWQALLGMEKSNKYLADLPLVGVLLGYIIVVFGFLSRRCERQADVFGCRTVSCSQADCSGHEDGLDPRERGRGLCATGIDTFIRALEKVALVNGISRDRPGFLQSWQHSSIARRVEFLQRVRLDRRVETRFQHRIALVKWTLFLILGAALTMSVLTGWSW